MERRGSAFVTERARLRHKAGRAVPRYPQGPLEDALEGNVFVGDFRARGSGLLGHRRLDISGAHAYSRARGCGYSFAAR